MSDLNDIKNKLADMTLPQKMRWAVELIEQGQLTYMQFREMLKTDGKKPDMRMANKKIVVESPLSGDFQRNYRFLLWCCRAVWLQEKKYAIASHLINPWFMDDTAQEERQAGIDNPWAWDGGAWHLFFHDLGVSPGMVLAKARCDREGINNMKTLLSWYHQPSFEAFERGEWPPHTPGFELVA